MSLRALLPLILLLFGTTVAQAQVDIGFTEHEEQFTMLLEDWDIHIGPSGLWLTAAHDGRAYSWPIDRAWLSLHVQDDFCTSTNWGWKLPAYLISLRKVQPRPTLLVDLIAKKKGEPVYVSHLAAYRLQDPKRAAKCFGICNSLGLSAAELQALDGPDALDRRLHEDMTGNWNVISGRPHAEAAPDESDTGEADAVQPPEDAAAKARRLAMESELSRRSQQKKEIGRPDPNSPRPKPTAAVSETDDPKVLDQEPRFTFHDVPLEEALQAIAGKLQRTIEIDPGAREIVAGIRVEGEDRPWARILQDAVEKSDKLAFRVVNRLESGGTSSGDTRYIRYAAEWLLKEKGEVRMVITKRR